MFHYLKYLYKSLILIFKSKYKWMLILFVLWLYRVDFIPADGGGFAKGLQVITIFGMLGLVMKYWNGIARIAYNNTNSAVKSLLWLYSFAVISTLWAFMPTFAFVLSFQNIVLMFVLLWLMRPLPVVRNKEQAEEVWAALCGKNTDSQVQTSDSIMNHRSLFCTMKVVRQLHQVRGRKK